MPAAATASGDGVSPAATAASSGSVTGSPASTARAEAGRAAGSSCTQAWIIFSSAGCAMRATLESFGDFASRCSATSVSTERASKKRCPVTISYAISPSA